MLRSEHILKGLGNQYYRATYKSMGFTTEDLKRPLIGIANAWSECVPGHYNLRQVAQRVKDGIYRAGGTPIEFGVIGGCDGTRRAVAEDLTHRFGMTIRPEELFFTCGAAAALISVIRALTVSPDSEFVAIAPYFPEYLLFV